MASIEVLTSRGHDLRTLICQYPLSTLRALVKAADRNRREHLVFVAQAIAVSVSNGMDLAFNKGKGKVLEKYTKRMLNPSQRNKSKGVVDAGNKLLGMMQGMNAGAKRRGNK